MSGRSFVPRVNRRRGAFQLVNAFVYIAVGASFFFMPSTPSRDSALQWMKDLHLPLEPFAALWILAGLIAIACAFRPRPKDAAGFIALVVAPGIWVGLFGIGALTTGTLLPVFSALVYGAFGVSPLIVSGMQGPKDRDHREVIL